MRSAIPFPRRAYDFIIDRPILAWACLVVPTVVFAAIKLVGKSLHLLDDTGEMRTPTAVAFWLVLAVYLAYTCLKSWADKWNQDAKRNGQVVLREMLDSANAVTEKKFRRFNTFIVEHCGKTGLCPFSDITQPRDQIEAILENLQTILHNICAIPRDQIGASLIFRTNVDPVWRWFRAVNVGDDIKVDDLLDNENSTLRVLLDNKRKTIFHADKRVARDGCEYVEAPKDRPHACVGSIICRDLSVGDDAAYVQAILSITTYGQQLCGEKDLEARGMIESIILHSFECRLRLELCLYYIKHVQSKHGC